MAITQGVSLDARNKLDTPDVSGDLEVARLDNGGFVAIGDGGVGDDGPFIQGGIYDAKGALVADISNVVGENGAVTQLSDGRILLAFDVAGGSAVQYRTVDAETGEVGDQFLASLSAENVQVAAGADGSAVFVCEKQSGEDTNIRVQLIDKNNSEVFSVDIDAAGFKDADPSVAVLATGDVVVTWTRTDEASGESDVMFAMYNDQGQVLREPRVLAGDNDINGSAKIVATDRGFAVAYQGRAESDLSLDILLEQFDFEGFQFGAEPTNISNRFLEQIGDDESDDADPYLSVGPDGSFLISYTQTSIETGQTDPVVAVLDTLGTLQSVQANFGTSEKPQTGTASVFFGVGNIAIFDILKGIKIEGQRLTGFRDSAGDKNGNFIGGDDFEDLMNGLGGDDTLRGGDNGDELLGGKGDDELFGESGDDTLNGEGGADTLNGGEGDDTYFASQGVALVEEFGGAKGGVDRVVTFGDFTLGKNFESLRLDSDSDISGVGNKLANLITTRGAGSNEIRSLGGKDTLSGGDGDDTLAGGAGSDSLNGGAGKDVLIGGAGADRLEGGGGADVFLFEAGKQGADVVAGFDVAADRFDLSGRSFLSAQASQGDTTLTYKGGTIVVDGVTGLKLDEWNDLVVG